jgi:hypothetical protein
MEEEDSLLWGHYYLGRVVGKVPFRLNIMDISEIDLPIPRYTRTSGQSSSRITLS